MPRRSLCLCGHAWSSHRHRRGECLAVVPTFVVGQGGVLSAAHEPCGCAVYTPQDASEPAQIPAGALIME